MICMYYTNIKRNPKLWKKNLTLTAKKHDGGVDSLNEVNEDWRRRQGDNINVKMEDEEAALRRKHVRNARRRWEGEDF